MAELPSGTVTFLLTDVEGSTALWEEAPEAMRAALARHDILIRAAIVEHGGHVVKTMGDGFHAAFARAPDALAAALDAQRRLAAEPWGEVGPLRVRMAVHTGVAELRDGDYYRPTMNGLARLVKATAGRQILASEATLQLAQADTPPTVRARLARDLTLRGISAPMRVFEVVAARDVGELPARAPLPAEQDRATSPSRQLLGPSPTAGTSKRGRRGPGPSASQADGGTAAGLRITMLGRFRVERGGREIDLGRSDARGWPQLFRCLLCRPSRRITKDEAYDLFWPDSALDAVHTTFRVSLSRFRLLLEPGVPHSQSIIVHNRDSVFLRPDADIWVDADEFERLIAAASRTAEPDELLEEADRLYTDDLLPDDRYADWAIPRRDRLRTLWTDLQFDLARRREARRDVNGAISALQRLLTADRRDERAARELMLLLARHGRRSEAVLVYEHLIDALRGGHGEDPAEPEDATETVRREIRTGSVAMVDPAIPSVFVGLVHAQRDTIPAETSTLIGREAEVERARARLLSPDVRLLSLVGAGGSGKTRLARAVATAVGEEFAGHVYYVDLAPITDHRLAVPRIAQVLGVRADGERPLTESLHSAIGKHRVLLVLDNLEQILEASLDVSALLAACPNVTVLVTSRSPLHLRGERIFDVTPLPTPAPASRTFGRPGVDAMAESPAVRLFVERAQDVRSDFALTDENAATVAEICRRLDGLPLAIELAAARVRLLSPEALLQRLDHWLPVLTGGARDLPARQRTLRDTIGWSYDLLTPAEQRLFRRLGVFVGGFTVEAAEAVGDAEGDLGIEPLDGMGSLAGKSLLRASETTDGEPGFEMLVTIREFAREQLELSGEAAAFRARHARYYRDLAEEIAPRLHGPHQARWLDRLDAEHGNLRAAMAWSAEHNLDLALGLGGALWRFWQVRGHVPEGRAWLERVVAADAARPARPPTPSRARALNAVAFLAFMAGAYERATARYRETLAIRRALDDREGIAESLNNLGLTLRCIGDHRGANDLFEQALHQTRALGNRAREANILNNLARSAYYQRQYAAAQALHEQALTAGRESGDAWAVAICLGDLGDVNQAQGDADTARRLYEESLAAWRALGDLRGVAQCLEGFAGLIIGARPEQAVRLFGAGAAVREAIGEPSSLLRRAQLEQTLARLRATLGPERFGAAWSEGRSLSAEQAVEVALAPNAADPPSSSDVSNASSTSNGWGPPSSPCTASPERR